MIAHPISYCVTLLGAISASPAAKHRSPFVTHEKKRFPSFIIISVFNHSIDGSIAVSVKAIVGSI